MYECISISHLLLGNGCLFLIGEFHQCTHIRAQVCFAANKQNAGIGAEVHYLGLPLHRHKNMFKKLNQSRNESYDVNGIFKALTQYLLESTVDGVWTADIEAQEHGIRVAVTKWPHIVIVRRSWNGTHMKTRRYQNRLTKCHGLSDTKSQGHKAQLISLKHMAF